MADHELIDNVPGITGEQGDDQEPRETPQLIDSVPGAEGVQPAPTAGSETGQELVTGVPDELGGAEVRAAVEADKRKRAVDAARFPLGAGASVIDNRPRQFVPGSPPQTPES
jgi:hypothetical protein